MKRTNFKIPQRVVWLLGISLFISLSAYGQYKVSGKVYDANTKECLAGVNIVITGTTQGTSSGSDCGYEIQSNDKIKSLTFSYTGYTSKEIEVTSDFMSVGLDESAIELDQVVVTASRVEQERKDIASSMSKISLSDIEDLKANYLPQLLQRVSSVHIADFGNEQQNMAIRQPLSFSRTQLVILEEGIPIGPVALTTSGDMSEINKEAVREIEIIRGPSSSLYGSEAIGGVVNYVYLNPPLSPSFGITLIGSDQQYKRINVSAGNTFKKFGITAGAYYAQRQNGFRENSDFDKFIFTSKMNYIINDKSKLTANFTFFDYQADFAGSVDSAHFYSGNISFNPYQFCNVHDKGIRSAIRFDQKWNEKSRTFFSLYFRYKYNEEIPTYRIKLASMFPTPKYTGEYEKNFYYSYGFLAQHKEDFKFLKSSLIGGLNFNYSPNDYYSEVINVTKENDYYSKFELTGVEVQFFNAYLLNSAFYMQYEANPLNKVKLIASFRYDRLDYKYDNHLEPTAISGAADTIDKFANFSPKVGVIYQWKRNLNLYFNFSQGFSPPLFSQLYKAVIVPVLEPSVYSNYEIGSWFSLFKDRLYMDVSLYQTKGKNEIIQVMEAGETVYRSTGETIHRGIESTSKLKLFNLISLNYAWTYAYHGFINFQQGTFDLSGYEMNIAPRYIGNLSLSLKPQKGKLKGLFLSAEWERIGSYFMDEYNSEKYEGYHMFNLRSSYKIKGFEVFINLLNVSDGKVAVRASKSYYGSPTRPIVSKSYSPGIPRTLEIGIGYNFNAKIK